MAFSRPSGFKSTISMPSILISIFCLAGIPDTLLPPVAYRSRQKHSSLEVDGLIFGGSLLGTSEFGGLLLSTGKSLMQSKPAQTLK